MNIQELIKEAKAAGVEVVLSGGSPVIRGDKAATEKWLPTLREHKAEIVHYLSEGEPDQFFLRELIPNASTEECHKAFWLCIGYREFLSVEWDTARTWAADYIREDRRRLAKGIPPMTAEDIRLSVFTNRQQVAEERRAS